MATRLIEIGEVDTQAIRDDHALSAVVSAYVPLKRAGAELRACCPFHHEKTPSFYVNDVKQFYHCFGCGAHGDVIRFMQEIHGLDFRGAVEKLVGAIIPQITADRIEALRERQRRFDAEEEARKTAATLVARERWIAADAGYLTHPYLESKGIGPHGTRLHDGSVLIPLIGDDGKIQTLQSIDNTGRKLFVSDAPVSGGLFVLGGKVAASTTPVLVCEGFATAASLQEATGWVVVCAFNSGNLLHVARRLAERYPDKEYLVAGDDDRGREKNVGREKAIEASAILKCRAVFPVFPDDRGTDFNDMATAYDLATVRALVEDGELPNGDPDPEDFAPTPWIGMDPATIPPREWLFGDILARRFVSVLVAPPGVGKSILTIEAALSVALKRDLGPFKAHEQANVWLFNNEDPRDELNRRISAFLIESKISPSALSGKLFVDTGEERQLLVARYDESGNVMRMPVVERMCRHIERLKIGLLIVDPFIETHEVNENDNGAISIVARLYREIAQRTGCAVWLVHHTRKTPAGSIASAPGDSDAGRGASALGGVARFTATLFNMSKADAEDLKILEEDRHLYVRFDDGKANLKLKTGEGIWWRKKSVSLGNERGFRPADSMGVLEWVDMEAAREGVAERQKDHWRTIGVALAAQMEGEKDITMNAAVSLCEEAGRRAGYESRRTLERYLFDMLRRPQVVGAWRISYVKESRGNGSHWVRKQPIAGFE